MEANDISAMREALVSCMDYFQRIDHPMNDYMRGLFETAYNKTTAALSKPPRNCDRYETEMREALGKVNEIYDILSKPCIVIEDARQACREARAVLIPAIDKPPRQNNTTGKGNAEKVNADGTEVTTPKHMIILIENCIKDIVSMTHGEFRPKEFAFNIAVTMSYVRLLDMPIGEGEEAKVTATLYQTMKWKYPHAEIVGVEDRDHYIVRVEAVVNGKPYSSYRKTLDECATRA